MICIWLATACAYAEVSSTNQHAKFSVSVVLSNDNEEYNTVFDALDKRLDSAAGSINISRYLSADYPADQKQSSVTPPDLIITIGTAAARRVAETGNDIPVVCSFLPGANFDAIWNNSDRAVSGIVLDQPFERYLGLLNILMEKGDKVGLFSAHSDVSHEKIIPLLQRSGLLPVVETTTGSVTAKNITHLLEASDIILLLPDPSILSAQRAKWLLYMAYREKKPVIAFAPSYVQAGALAALYSRPESIGQQTAELVMALAWSSEPVADAVISLGRSHSPETFVVDTNSKVAGIIGFNIPEAEQLKNKIIKDLGAGK